MTTFSSLHWAAWASGSLKDFHNLAQASVLSANVNWRHVSSLTSLHIAALPNLFSIFLDTQEGKESVWQKNLTVQILKFLNNFIFAAVQAGWLAKSDISVACHFVTATAQETRATDSACHLQP